MIVADANTLAYVWLPSLYSEEVEALLNNERQWAAPFLWRSEFRSILAKYLKANYYSFSQISEVMRKAEEFMSSHEYFAKSDSVLNLVNESGCSAYDCEYIAVAKELGVKLVTYDKQLIKEFPDTAMTAKQYLASSLK